MSGSCAIAAGFTADRTTSRRETRPWPAPRRLGEDGEREFALSPGGLNWLQAGFLSAVFAQLGDVGSAVVWHNRVTRRMQRYYHVQFERHWFWEPVRSDPRFRAVLAGSR